MGHRLVSTIALTNSSGSTLASYAYEPFGNTTVTSGSSANPYQYTGRENDGTGAYFYRARYYSPTLQRFVSEDPIGLVGGMDFYTYAANSPTNLVDPTGNDGIVVGAEVGCFFGPEGCAAGAIAGAMVDLAVLAAGTVAVTSTADALSHNSQSSRLGGDDPAFANPEATRQAISDIQAALKDPDLDPRDRSKLLRRLKELMRRLSKKAHGADKDVGVVLPMPTSGRKDPF